MNQKSAIQETNIDNVIINKTNILELDSISVTSINSNLSNDLMLKNISDNILHKLNNNKTVIDNNINIDNYNDNDNDNKPEDKIIDNTKDKNESIVNYLNNTIIEFEEQNICHFEKKKDNTNANANVTFTSNDLNDIKSYNINNNNNNNPISISSNNNIDNNNDNDNDNLSSIHSESDINYINAAKKQLPIEITKINKHIRVSENKKNKNKNKNKNKINSNELDEIDYLYNKLQDYIRYMKIDRSNYIIVITKSMEIIENYHTTIEIDKKITVIKALTRIITIDLSLSKFDKKLFLLSINNIIEIIIICSKINKKKIIKDESINYENITLNTKHNNIKHDYINNENFRNDIINNNELVFASSGQIIHSLIDKLTTIIIKKQYNADKLFVNICTITDILMILVNKNIYLTNIEKKNIIIQTFTKFINEKLEYIIDLDKAKKNELIFALDSVPVIIDLLISVQNGKFIINKKINNTKHKSFFKTLLCCV